jgi:hypothetical protein
LGVLHRFLSFIDFLGPGIAMNSNFSWDAALVSGSSLPAAAFQRITASGMQKAFSSRLSFSSSVKQTSVISSGVSTFSTSA